MSTSRQSAENVISYLYSRFRADLEEARTIDENVQIVHAAIRNGVSPGDVLAAVPHGAHPFGIMSQLSELLGHDVRQMTAYMDALLDVDPDEWADGEAQPFVDAYWRTVITQYIKQCCYRRAFEVIGKATRGFGSTDTHWFAENESPPRLQLVAARDGLWRLVHQLHRAMKNDGLIVGNWMGRACELTKRIRTVNGVWQTRPVAGASLVQRLGAVRKVDENTTSQFGSQVLEIADYFSKCGRSK